MTLQQWLDKRGKRGTNYIRTTIGRLVEYRHGDPVQDIYTIPDGVWSDRAELWTLEDYRVTSVSGGAIWFQRR